MVFSSALFVFMFLPLALGIYYILTPKFRNIGLLVISLIFFAWAHPRYILIILFSIAVNYISALALDNSKTQTGRKVYLAISVITNLGLLFYYKYFDFTISSINRLTGHNFPLRNIILPIGISFFTFQGMSYVIDVYRNTVKVQKNPLKVALYIVLFPQLIAGPIVRYSDIEKQIDERHVTLDDFAYGIQRFICGLAKKAIIANTLAVTVDSIWNRGIEQNTVAIAWLGSIAYMFQIYFDFSGYSDMAIGLGRMVGFRFNENFNLPYISKSISEFWRRWHISLSSWFKDYVYIPLGGNRKHVYLNLAIVFLLTGIWHGASWHYIAWGIWNGFFILVERVIRNKSVILIKNEKVRNIVSHIYLIAVVLIGWVIFRAPGIKAAAKYILTMFGMRLGDKPGFSFMWYADRWTVFVMILAVFFSTSLPQKLYVNIKDGVNEHVLSILKYACLLVLFYMSMLRIVSGTYNPFIYFQF